MAAPEDALTGCESPGVELTTEQLWIIATDVMKQFPKTKARQYDLMDTQSFKRIADHSN